MLLFPEDAGLEEMVRISLSLEDGAKRFYGEVSKLVEKSEDKNLFEELIKAEARHIQNLKGLADVAIDTSLKGYIESGMQITEALNWIKGKGVHEILEYSLYIETNSYDLYLRMREKTENSEAEKVFSSLAGEEKNHLERLSKVLESRYRNQ